MRSVIGPDTLRAYRAARYRVHGHTPMTLRVDRRCPALAALHARHGVGCSAFVTACNPLGRQLGEAANASRQAALVRELRARGLPVLDGIGEDPAGEWPTEPSALAIGLELDAARTLGGRFEQNALLWSGADAIPRLILLR